MKSVVKICLVCKKKFKIFPCWLRDGKGGKYCSRQCASIGRPRKSKTIFQNFCEECGVEFSYRKGRGGTYQFCSIPCMAAWRGRQMRGNHHPFWRGGMEERTHLSRKTIKTAIRKIGRCEQCGGTSNLQGHHVNSFASCKEKREDESNIQVLCVDCHARQHPKLSNWIRSKLNGKTLD